MSDIGGENLFALLQKQAGDRPEAVALWHCHAGEQATPVTFAALASLAARYAQAFAQQAADSHIIPLLLPKSPDCVAAMIGAIGAGKAFACIHRKLRWPQVSGILQTIGPTLALTDGPGVMTLAAGAGAGEMPAGVKWRVLMDPPLIGPQKATFERLRAMMELEPFSLSPVLRGEGRGEGSVDEKLEARMSKLERTSNSASPSAGPSPQPSPLSTGEREPEGVTVLSPLPLPACCLFTSGSTGSPKGVLISGADLRARAAAEVEWFGLTERDVLLSILPFSFDVGLNQLFSALAAGASLVLLDSFLPADILRAAQQFKVTGISGVPAVWADMLIAKMMFQTDGPHAPLRYVTVSGGDLPQDQLDRLPELAPGVGIFKTYGQSEAFRAASLRPEDFDAKRRSVGRPFLGTRVYVVREDQSFCHPGEEGEIVHTGLGVMLGYLGERETDEKLRPNPFHGSDDPATVAVFTGDVGYFDLDGFLYVKGRRDAMLKVAGNRVYPREIVDQLLAGGHVQEAEVVGVKGADGQTQLVAFVVMAPGLTRPLPDLRRDWAARLPSYMVPRQAVPIDQIPRLGNGKPDRPALIERARLLLAAESK